MPYYHLSFVNTTYHFMGQNIKMALLKSRAIIDNKVGLPVLMQLVRLDGAIAQRHTSHADALTSGKRTTL